jgi:hypothetical protein
VTAALAPWLRLACSDARLAPYLSAAGGDPVSTEALYLWNVQVSKEFYWSLHFLEIAFRNAAHAQLAAAWPAGPWWAAVTLKPIGRNMIREAEAKCRREGKPSPSADDIVAQLSFGFWVSLLATHYHRILWVPALHKAVPYYRGHLSELHEDFEAVRRLRNRIMHHEPIHHRHLAADHQKIQTLLGYIDPALAAEVSSRDRVPSLLAARSVPAQVRRRQVTPDSG